MSEIADYVAPGRCGCCGRDTNHYWTPKRMVEMFLRWTEEHGEIPCAEEWLRGTPTNPPNSHVIRVFGKWSNLARAAGLTPLMGRKPWRKDQIADAMLDHLFRTGRWPNSSDWQSAKLPEEPPRPSSATVFARFGSWDAAMKHAGRSDALTDYVEPRCIGCGAELENNVEGCTVCNDRHRNRARRQAETAAVSTKSKATVSDRKEGNSYVRAA